MGQENIGLTDSSWPLGFYGRNEIALYYVNAKIALPLLFCLCKIKGQLMDAKYFRGRAVVARELACNGEDVRLVEMLLEVAADMDAEADAIDAENAARPRALNLDIINGHHRARLQPASPELVSLGS